MNVYAPLKTTRLADNRIPKEPYISESFAALEREKLWPRVWQVACREEEVARPGRYVTYDIGDESIIVTRDASGALRAFYNVCQHRGRRLTSGCGATGQFFCKYHGWRWNLDGSNAVVIDREDWDGELADADIRLKEVQLGAWGGFVFINMDPTAEPLEDFLQPVIKAWKNFRLEDLRYSWLKSVKLPCNWKVALDVFIEGYHAQTAHRQGNSASGDNRYVCEILGSHSVFRQRGPSEIGQPSRNYQLLGGIAEDNERFASITDLPGRVATYFEILHQDLDCMLTPRFMRAVRRMTQAVGPDADYATVMGAILKFHVEEGAKDGVDWSHLSLEDMAYLGMDWHVFPNIALLPTADAVLGYRARPGKTPDECTLDIYSLERFGPGQAPDLKREEYERWSDASWPRIFIQDFENVGDIQAGMKSRGFVAGRANPIAEATVANFHAELRRFVGVQD
jgi:nitrite reductase/ring-hydroxylating ferredoxin subunit